MQDNMNEIKSPPASQTSIWPAGIRIVHWTTALLLTIGIVSMLIRDRIESHDLRTTLMDVHRQAGIAILLLVLIRIGVRFRSNRPRWIQSTFARFSAAAAHLMSYAFLLALPVMGWLLTNAKGKPVSLLGLPLPQLIERNRDLAEQIESWHTLAGWALLALIGIHVIAALWHHWYAKDDVLRSMLVIRPPTPATDVAADRTSGNFNNQNEATE